VGDNMDIIERAINLFFLGKIRQAESILNDVMKNKKNDPKAWFLKALIERKKGDNNSALNAINKALELNNEFVEAWILKHYIMRDLKKYEEALRAIDEAIRLTLEKDDYEDYELLIEKARTLILLGDLKRAKGIIFKIRDLNPEDSDLEELFYLVKESERRRN